MLSWFNSIFCLDNELYFSVILSTPNYSILLFIIMDLFYIWFILNVEMHDPFLWMTRLVGYFQCLWKACWRTLSSNGSYSNVSDSFQWYSKQGFSAFFFSSQTLNDYSRAHLLIVSLFARVFEWDVSVCLLSAHKCVAYITDSSLKTRFLPHTAHMWSGIWFSPWLKEIRTCSQSDGPHTAKTNIFENIYIFEIFKKYIQHKKTILKWPKKIYIFKYIYIYIFFSTNSLYFLVNFWIFIF